MPWKLRKAPKKDLYWVINKETGKKYSKEPLPKERAEAQMRALYANAPDAKEGKGFFSDIERRIREDPNYIHQMDPLGPSLKPKGGKKGGFLIAKDRDPAYYKKPVATKGGRKISYIKWGDIKLPVYDDMNGSGVLDTLKNKYKEIKDKGAAFLTGTNYVGPFNRLDDEYIRTHPPTDKIDEGAMKHDLEYSRIAKLRKAGTPKAEIERLIRVSDDEFLDNIKKHWRTNPRAAAMGYAGIKGKNVVEDVAGLDRNLFVGEGMKGGMKTPSGFEVSLLPDQRVRVQGLLSIFPMDFIIRIDDSREVLRDFLEEVAPIWMNRARQFGRSAQMANPFMFEGELWDAIQQLRQQTTTDADPAPETTRTGKGKRGRGACVSASAERNFPAHDPNEPGNAVDVLTQLYLEAKRQNPQLGASPQNITRFARGFQHQMNPIANLTQAEEQSLPFRLGGDAYFKHCHMAGMGKMRGRGFFGDFWNAGKQFASNVVERVKQTGESVANVFRGKAPRMDLPPKVRQLLGAYGNRPIVRMFVRRDPIQSAIDKALNVISMGSWFSLKQKYGYDTFYHLQLEVIVRVSDSDDTNARFVLQKNEVIDVSPAQPSTDKTEMVEVPMTEGHTMNSLLSNAKQTMGHKFYYYDAFHNNCQDFVGALLYSSGMMRPDISGFIKQPVDQLVQEISMTDRIARGITDLGGIVDVGLQGKGGLQPRAAFAAQLKEAGVSPSAYLETAKKKANALGLAGNMLGFSSDDKHKLQMPNAEGKMIRFGAVKLGDYILYTLQRNPEAEKHRKAYLARATKIKGDWAKDPYSANSLAIGVLW